MSQQELEASFSESPRHCDYFSILSVQFGLPYCVIFFPIFIPFFSTDLFIKARKHVLLVSGSQHITQCLASSSWGLSKEAEAKGWMNG